MSSTGKIVDVNQLLPFPVLLLFLLVITYPSSNQPTIPFVQMEDETSSRFSLLDKVELELSLQGYNPASRKLGSLLRDLHIADEAETGIATKRSYKERAIELFKSNNIEYSVGYYGPSPLASALVCMHTVERISSRKDIKAKVKSFQNPFFSLSEIEILIYIRDDESLGGCEIIG